MSTLYVTDVGTPTPHYATVALAVAAASDGDIIIVYPGTHSVAGLVVDKAVVIRGTDAYPKVTFTGTISVTKAGVTIEGVQWVDTVASGHVIDGGTFAPVITRCLFLMTIGSGGAADIFYGNCNVSYCWVCGTTVGTGGTASYIFNGDVVVDHCTVSSNTMNGSSKITASSSGTFTNCIFWATGSFTSTPAVTYSVTTLSGAGNITDDPSVNAQGYPVITFPGLLAGNDGKDMGAVYSDTGSDFTLPGYGGSLVARMLRDKFQRWAGATLGGEVLVGESPVTISFPALRAHEEDLYHGSNNVYFPVVAVMGDVGATVEVTEVTSCSFDITASSPTRVHWSLAYTEAIK